MDAKDQSIWDLQVRELQEGSKEDQEFLKFFLEWARVADSEFRAVKVSLLDCVRWGFISTEKSLGVVPLHVYSRGLSFFVMYWTHGKELEYQLPSLERKVMTEGLKEFRYQDEILTLEDLPEE